MNDLFGKLSKTESEKKAILSLLEDSGSYPHLLKAMGKRLLENEDIILEDSIGQLMIITSIAPFAESQEECVNVAQTVNWGLNRTDILPLVSKHNGKDLANRCLISLAFFYRAMEERTKRYGCPNPEFYREIGTRTYYQIGMEDLGYHFQKWECFLQEFLV